MQAIKKIFRYSDNKNRDSVFIYSTLIVNKKTYNHLTSFLLQSLLAAMQISRFIF